MFVVCSRVLGDRSKTCVLCFDSIRNRSAAADAAVRSLGGTYLEMSTCSSHQQELFSMDGKDGVLSVSRAGLYGRSVVPK